MKTIRKIIHSDISAERGTPIRRALPSLDVAQISPFLLLDHIGPIRAIPGRPFRVAAHPNRGFELVTFLFEGGNEYHDRFGGHGVLDSGDVQWMTAGSGIIHRDGVRPEYANRAGPFHAVQLWVNLPSTYKMTPPEYQDISATNIPVWENEGVRLRIVSGEFYGVKGPAATFTPMFVAHGIAKKGASIEIPIPLNFNVVIYVTLGSLNSDGQTIGTHQLTWYENNGTSIPLLALEDCEFLLLSGEPINEPVAAHGPFVMNTAEELHQAVDDYNDGKMGPVVTDQNIQE